MKIDNQFSWFIILPPNPLKGEYIWRIEFLFNL